jgi:hypothetical protein
MNSLPTPSSEAQEQHASLSSDQHPQHQQHQNQEHQHQLQAPHNDMAMAMPPSTLTLAGPHNVPAPPSVHQQQLLLQHPLQTQLPNPTQHLAPQAVHIAPASIPMTLSQIQASIPPLVQHHSMPLSAQSATVHLQQYHPTPVNINILQQQAHLPSSLLQLPPPFLHPQLLPTTAASVATLMNANKGTTQIPPIFRNRQLRSGKWTEEEEEYADLLIELFEKGQILEEKNGCTLRSFLSRKLHCAPMRISKKYAGKGIGKMVFLSKTHNHHYLQAQAATAALMMGYPTPYSIHGGGAAAGGTGTGTTTATSAASTTRLLEAEAKFYKVAFADAVPTGVSVFPHQSPNLCRPCVAWCTKIDRSVHVCLSPCGSSFFSFYSLVGMFDDPSNACRTIPHFQKQPHNAPPSRTTRKKIHALTSALLRIYIV